MKTFLLSLILLFILSAASAQLPGVILGKLIKDGKPFTGATITLYKLSDSSVARIASSDKNGSYEFTGLAYGKYIIQVTAAAHRKLRSKMIELTQASPTASITDMLMANAPQNLQDVTVKATRPLIEQKIDRTIVNVDASITNAGTSALEILEKSPGVSVDKEGIISLKGKDGVLVTIDGRPTQLSGTDLANYLRGMNSAQMDQVEIMTNPPAKYDAAGNAGVINIKTRKNSSMGYNGIITIAYLQGRYPKTSESFNFNYREGKVNFFSNFSHNSRKVFEKLTIQRNLLDGNSSITENYFDQAGYKIARGNSINARAGLDYNASKKTSMGIVLNAMAGPNSVTNNNRTEIFSPLKELETITLAYVSNKSQWQNLGGNLNFRSLLNSKGRELSADADYMNYRTKTGQFLQNSVFDPNGNLVNDADTLIGTLPQNIKVYSARADYLHPFNKSSKLETGLKLSHVKTDNDAVYDSIQNGLIIHDHNRTNHFVYSENISAAYANYNTVISKKLSGQFGLRLEHTVSKGNQLTTSQAFERNYTSLFPTAYLQYKADDKNNFVLNYGRRIRRPDYGSLNPFIRFIDRYTYNKGNPNLRPQFSDNMELSYSYRNFLTATLNYSAINNIIQNVIEQQGQEAYQTVQNIASMKQVGLAVSFNKQMNRWWNNSSSLNIFNNRFSGVVNESGINLGRTSLILSMTQQFRLSGTLTAELSGKYRSALQMGVLHAKPAAALTAGLSQQVLKNKGTLRLTLRDIFYSQRMKAIIRYGNVDAAFQEINDSRIFVASFTYRFNKGKNVLAKKKTGGSANEESERMGIDQ